MSTAREVQSGSHKKGTNGGVALRGTGDREPGSSGPQVGLG